jgi:oxygen-dependent protoporphyrinogen oxidase
MTRTAVIGGGVAGLVAARAAAVLGEQVTLFEAADRLGGLVDSAMLGGMRIDLGAESIATRDSSVPALLGALGLETAPAANDAARLFADGVARPLPVASLLGIPGSPLASDVREIIGTPAAVRAWADRIIPELHIGRERNLGALVRRRMGSAVLDQLVRPIVDSVYGVDPEQADIDQLVPALNSAITRSGTLSSAVLSIRGSSPAGAAVSGIVGGVHLLPEALAADLAERGVDIRTKTAVESLEASAPGWTVTVQEEGSADAEGLQFDRVVLATSGSAARSLLSPLVGLDLDQWPEGRTTRVVAVAVQADFLDSAPLGTGALVSRRWPNGPVALTHSSAKWPWLRERLGRGRHVLRLSYREPVEIAEGGVRHDLELLFGRPLPDGALIDMVERRWVQDAPRARIGVASRVAAVERAVAERSGLVVTGSWIAGTGLASVIPHAQATATPRLAE